MPRRYSTLVTYRNLLLSGLVFLMGLVSTSTFAQDQAAQNPEAAKEFINKLSNDAVAVWSDASRTEAEREEAFRDLLYEGFDVDFIAKLVLGRHMRTASKEQLREYQKLFPAYIVNNFARRIGNYGDEKLEVEGTTPAGSRDLFVRSKIVRPGGEPISADWRMRSVNGKLQIVDIKVEGISLAVTQRDEFSSIIERKGFDGLLDTLRKGALLSTEG